MAFKRKHEDDDPKTHTKEKSKKTKESCKNCDDMGEGVCQGRMGQCINLTSEKFDYDKHVGNVLSTPGSILIIHFETSLQALEAHKSIVQQYATTGIDVSQEYEISRCDSNLLIRQYEESVKAVEVSDSIDAELVLFMSLDIRVVNGTSEKRSTVEKDLDRDIRKMYNQSFLEKVCTLRNSGGGIVVIHLLGQKAEDTYIGYFDEMVADGLQRLLNPGEMYVDQFVRAEFVVDHESFIRFHVMQSSQLSTADFKTKLPLDDKFIDPDSKSISNILLGKRNTSAANQNEMEGEAKHENRHLQLKSLPDGDLHPKKRNAQHLSDVIWGQLKLPETITAFMKLRTGGKYKCGIREKDIQPEGYKYKTKQYENLGLRYRYKKEKPTNKQVYKKEKPTNKQVFEEKTLTKMECDTLMKVLSEKVKDKMTAIGPNGKKDDAFSKEIQFCIEKENNVDILEVQIPWYPGLVFYDPNGPVSYKYDDGTNSIIRLSLEQWQKKIKEENSNID